MATQRTKDPWGHPIKERPKRDPWGRPVAEANEPAPKRNAWGRPIKPPKPSPLPECVALFKPVEKLEGRRTHDAWGHPLPVRGMPAKEFGRAVAEAQAAIFAKARPSRPSDDYTAGYVDAVTRQIRERSTTDAEFVTELQKATAWDHIRPTRTAATRTETRRGPNGLPINETR